MARRPNYNFERMERERQKAAKKAERLKVKQARAAQRREAKTGEETPSPTEE